MSEATGDAPFQSDAAKPGDTYTAIEKGADALLALIEEEKTKATAQSSSRILELENHRDVLKNNFSKLESVAKTVNAALGKTMGRCRELTEESQRANEELAATRGELSALKDKLKSQSDAEKELDEDPTDFRAMLQSRMGIVWDGSLVTLHERHDLDTIRTCFAFLIKRIESVKETQDGYSPFLASPQLNLDAGQPTSEGPDGGVEESMNAENCSQQQSMQGTCAQIQELSQPVPGENLAQATVIGHDETSNVSNEIHVPDQIVDVNDDFGKTCEIACPPKDPAPSSGEVASHPLLTPLSERLTTESELSHPSKKDETTSTDGEGCALSDTPLQVPVPTSTKPLITSNLNGGQLTSIYKSFIHGEGQPDNQKVLVPEVPSPPIESARRDVASGSETNKKRKEPSSNETSNESPKRPKLSHQDPDANDSSPPRKRTARKTTRVGPKHPIKPVKNHGAEVIDIDPGDEGSSLSANKRKFRDQRLEGKSSEDTPSNAREISSIANRIEKFKLTARKSPQKQPARLSSKTLQKGVVDVDSDASSAPNDVLNSLSLVDAVSANGHVTEAPKMTPNQAKLTELDPRPHSTKTPPPVDHGPFGSSAADDTVHASVTVPDDEVIIISSDDSESATIVGNSNSLKKSKPSSSRAKKRRRAKKKALLSKSISFPETSRSSPGPPKAQSQNSRQDGSKSDSGLVRLPQSSPSTPGKRACHVLLSPRTPRSSQDQSGPSTGATTPTQRPRPRPAYKRLGKQADSTDHR